MKLTIINRIWVHALLLFSFAIGLGAAEGFMTWDDVIGRSFEAKVIDVSARTVRLENREGVQIDFPIADLKPSSKSQLGQWQSLNSDKTKASVGEARSAGKVSVFDDVLIGNLERLDGKRLKRFGDATRPEKYYIFYYTASWCGPCQRYTPSLVEWYEKNKNENFELVLISSDRDEDAMEGYAVDKKMPWPHLELDEVKEFREEFDHGVTGIPSVIVCEIDGTNLGNFRSKLAALTEMVK